MNADESATSDATARVAAAIVISLAIGLVALTAALLPVSPIPTAQLPLPENAGYFEDSTRQRRVHELLLLATAAAMTALTVSGGAPDLVRRVAARVRPGTAVWRASSIAFPPLIVVLSLLALPKFKWVIASLVTTGGLLYFGARCADRVWFRRSILIGVVLSSALMVVPGLLLPPDLSSSGAVAADQTEVHYSIIVSPGDRLSQGGRLFANVMPHYGMVTPFVLATVERARGLLSFGDHIRLIQLMQVVFAVGAFLSFWLWAGKRLLPTTIAFLPVLAYVHTLHISVFCPNQSGWRFAGLPWGICVLIAIRERQRRVAMILGLAAGGFLLFNPETGIVLTIAYLTYLLTFYWPKPRRWASILRGLAVFALAAGVLPAAFIVVFRLVLGYIPSPYADGGSYALTRFASGYGGLRIHFGVAWIVILAQALFVAVFLSMSTSTLTSRQRVSLSIAVATLVWFGYFANRPHPWNLWTLSFLFGFSVIDMLRADGFKRYLAALRQRHVALGAAILVFVVANGLPIVLSGLRDNLNALRLSRRAPAEIVSDVRLDPAYADAVRRRAAYVRARAKVVPLYYFSSNTYLVPLVSGVIPNLPFSDPYVEGFTMDDFNRSAEWIEAHAPGEVLFDDPTDGPAGTAARQVFIARLKSRLAASYRQTHRTSGWEVWERVAKS